MSNYQQSEKSWDLCSIGEEEEHQGTQHQKTDEANEMLQQVVVATKMTERRLMGNKLSTDEAKRLTRDVKMQNKRRSKNNSYNQFLRQQTAFICSTRGQVKQQLLMGPWAHGPIKSGCLT